ncbi:hypothetical protein ASPWEDRAFT_101029 [Aspergillus wentii DTO 134E9]|uniref:ABC transporter n=1 Tax=Aspergillus wentii DTO 134E9 TaxID=1073089 RepID=A0A1L9RYW8_ASPWE|nr:uncharacterized protein ASPWEDRAFT_101029 [Aspergillus wentii DTO 134E9]KAI9932592.1 hypothetical protein MW887_008837 [Aspergillus wentii]OJJ40160.1 hypothetical protein ASPWEDRAFT_101029 [Aspergillus wentii DTO 134E9]
MNSQQCENNSFGPTVSDCRGNFDFTKTFEDIFFAIVPAVLFLLAACLRIEYLRRQPRIVQGISYQILKLILLVAYFALQLSRAIVLALHDASRLTVWATALTVVGAAAMIALSLLEHTRSPRPSTLLAAFLLLTVLFDVVLTRTSWLGSLQPWQTIDARIQTAAVALKVVILMAESKTKEKRIINWSTEDHGPEETTGIISLGFLAWLNPLFVRGYREHLTVDKLYAIDQRIGAESMLSSLSQSLNNGRPGRRLSLATSLARTLAWPFLLPVLPRLAMIGFTFCQPFFITALISNTENTITPSTINNGYGLIGACIFIYGGIALSTTFYQYYSHRAMYMIRAALVSAIYQKTLDSGTKKTPDAAAVTLMSTDVERIMTGWVDIHAVWASMIEIALGCWLLHLHLGEAFISPVIVIAVCTGMMAWVGSTAGKTQAAWMDKIQHRVSITTAVIANIKALKISGIAPGLAHMVQWIREDEIQVGNRFRFIQVVAATIASAPMCLSPVFAFAFTGQNLDVSGFFASLSFLVLLTTPLGSFFQQIPNMLAGFACLARIQAYLETDPRREMRIGFEVQDKEKSQPCFPAHALISITNGYFGWAEEKPVLRNINASIPAGQLTIVVGPVACGKSTLCKTILGEIPFSRGEVRFAHPIPHIGFCDQTPFLSSVSIRENITGSAPFDLEKYRDVITATALDLDIAAFSSGHDTMLGGGGSMLSGGQKQRLSLARALYHDSPLLILDDVLTGLDHATESEVFRRVLGPDGLVRRRGTTAILFTHSGRHLPSANHIIALGEDGTVLENSQLTDLTENKEYSAGFGTNNEASSTSTGADISLEKESNLAKEKAEPDHDQARQTGDIRIYTHYFGTIRAAILGLFFLACIMFGFGNSFPTIWISFWSSDSYGKSNAFYIGIFSALRVLQMVGFSLAAFVSLGPMVADAGAGLHKNALTTVIRASLRFFSTTSNGVITNLFSQDTTIIDTELPQNLFNLAAGLCAVIGMACVIVVASPWLALAYPVLAAILWVVQRVYLRTSRQLRFLDLEAKSPLYTDFLETIQGITTIRAFGWAAQKLHHNYQLVDRSQRPAYLLAMIQLWLLLLMNMIVFGLATLLTTMATQLRTNPGFTGASLVTLMSFGELIAILVKDYTAFETSIGAVSRLKAFSEKVKPEDQDGEGLVPGEEWPTKGSVEIKALSASYDDFHEKPLNLILKNINLSVPPGQKVAICGRTGSGKSSLILLLLRLLDPIPSSSTEFTIDDLPVAQIDRSILRDRIIAVPQDPVFLPEGNTIKANLDPSNLATDDECLAVLDTVQLTTLAMQKEGLGAVLTANQLSSGQKKLFNLGRAILRRAVRDRSTLHTEKHGGILLLDEISSGVDTATEKTMHRIIANQFADYTIISVVHSLDIVPVFFDRVVVIDQGVIVESGSPGELLQTQSWFKELLHGNHL